MISGNKTVLNKARAQAKSVINVPDFARVQFFTFEELNAFLETLNANAASTLQTVRGYKVKTSYKTLSESEKKARKKVIAETILTALRKEKNKE
jgi:hypothetical protein